MKASRFTAEEITRILAEAAPRGAVQQVSRKYNVSAHTISVWRKKFGGMQSQDVRRLRELEQENNKLKRIVANLMLDNECLKEINSKKW